MCMEDIRMGRRTSSHADYVTMPAGSPTVILPANPRRISAIVSMGTTGLGRIGVSGSPPTATAGIQLSDAERHIVLSLLDVGVLITKEWSGWSDAGDTWYVVETLLEDQ